MHRALLIGGGVLTGLVVVGAGSVIGGSMQWNSGTGRLADSLVGAAEAAADIPCDAPGVLPAPVERYLRRSLPGDGGTIRIAIMEQEGEFRTGEREDSWRPFTATQTVRAYPPAFVWDAKIAMSPLLSVRVRDAYLDGTGVMKGRMAGIVSVVDMEGSPALAEGALVRYLAEAAWLPSRLLEGRGLTWQAVDDTTALATLTDGDLSVQARFRFNAEGDIIEVFVPDRGRDVNGEFVPTPWVGRFRDHRVISGFRLPVRGEVSWVLPEGELTYWRGRLGSVRFRIDSVGVRTRPAPAN